MITFSLLISRLVPLMLAASVCLIVARAFSDWLARRNAQAGRVTFVAIVAAAAIGAAFFLAQTGCLIAASTSDIAAEPKVADAWYKRYEGMHGRISRRAAYRWGMALMYQHRWRDAQSMFLRTGVPSPQGLRLDSDVVLTMGEALYYSGDFARAEQAFTVAKKTTFGYLRFYFLGRLAERRDPARALAYYKSALEQRGDFFPAFYCLARLMMVQGKFDDARTAIRDYGSRLPGVRQNQLWHTLEQAAETKQVPPDAQFYVLQTA